MPSLSLPALLLALTTFQSPDSLPLMFRGDAAHQGVFPAASGAYGGIAWRLGTGGAVRSSPVVAGGTVYVGSTDHRVYAADAASGAVRWRYDAGSPVSATPAVSRTLVVIAAWDGSVHAIDRRTGRRVWRVATGPLLKLAWGYESGDNWTSSPTIVGGMVVVGSGDGGLYALDLATGRTRWRGATGGRIRSSPAVAGDQVVVGSFDGYVYSFDRTSGRQRWRFATEGVHFASDTFGFDRKSIQSSPAIAGDLVLVGARDGFFYGLDLATGRERWRVDHKVSWVNCSAAVAEGTAFVGTSDGRFVQAVDLATGQERWRRDSVGIVWSSPSVAGNVVYAATTRGPLLALDRATGRELWRVQLTAGSFSSPAIADNRLYLGSEDGGLYALDLTAPAALRRMVYWDSAYAGISFLAEGRELRDYLARHGYTVVGSRELLAAMNSAPGSVVVFAVDYLPPELAGSDPARGPFRRYLEAGGRVVWPGWPPLVVRRDTSTQYGLKDIDRPATRTLLGVGHEGGNFDQRPVPVITEAGRRWGLSGTWLANWGADTAGVSLLLAIDDQGHAPAWLQRYGGNGGIFARIPIPQVGEAGLPVFGMVQRVAEGSEK